MSEREIRELLKNNTNMTDYDICRHIKDGVFCYKNSGDGKKEFINECLSALMDEEEAEEAWEDLEVIGNFKVDFAL